MKSFLPQLLFLGAILTSHALDDGGLRRRKAIEFEVSSLEDDDTIFDQKLTKVLRRPSLVEKTQLGNGTNIVRCIDRITKEGLKSISDCEYAIEYCQQQPKSSTGNGSRRREGEDEELCREMLAMLERLGQKGKRRETTALSMGYDSESDDELFETLLLCEDLLQQKEKCKAGELYGQVPGNSLRQKCFRDDQDKRSNTRQMPHRYYQRYTMTSSSESKLNDGNLLVEVYTIPIGQGDCNVIKCNRGKNVIMFDCGSSGGNYLKEGKKYESFIPSLISGARLLTIVISHAHRDHYSMIKAINNYFTGEVQIIVGGKLSDYPIWLINIASPVADETSTGNFCNNQNILFDMVQGDLESSNLNERGMLMKLSCKTCKSSLLFTGDMEGDTAEHLATSPHSNFLRSTHYKMAHHGASDKANKKEWLEAIRPVEVHVSQMYNHGSYHHPRCKAFKRLIDLGSIGMASGAPGATPHDLACFGEKEEHYKPYDQCVYHRIFSTAPRKDKLCLIVLSFIAHQEALTEYYCVKHKA